MHFLNLVYEFSLILGFLKFPSTSGELLLTVSTPCVDQHSAQGDIILTDNFLLN